MQSHRMSGHSRCARTVFFPRKINFKTLQKIYPSKTRTRLSTFSPQTCHVYHTKNHVLHPVFRKNPCKNPTPPRRKKLHKKRWPRNRFCGAGASSSQTARKPNSVLDDHSSRRHITEPLQQPTRRFWLPEGSLRLRASGRYASCRLERSDRIPAYLVLLRVGFTLPRPLLPARCALTAPFHPYLKPRT